MTEQPPKIENFESFLKPNFQNGEKILSYTSRYLTKPGDNYGSCMLAASVKIRLPNGSEETLELVVKMPPTNEIFWKLFEPERTCLTENAIYNDLVPALEELQMIADVPQDERIDVFPKCYGSRISLQPDAIQVDKDALLVLENLVLQGYKVTDRLQSYDLQHAKVILKNLAQYHALPIALRMQRPKLFREKIMPNIQRYDMANNFEEGLAESLIQNSKSDIETHLPEFNTKCFMDKLDKLVELSTAYMNNPNQCEDSIFTTVAHYDFWVNNMMILYDENENPIKIKILDFQMAQYESLAHDVIFFIFTSVKSETIAAHYDELLQYYYDEFIASLKRVDGDVSQYSMEKFLAEIKRLAPIQFHHILVMLKVVFIEKQGLPEDFKDMDTNTIQQKNAFSHTYFNKLRDVLKVFKERDYMRV